LFGTVLAAYLALLSTGAAGDGIKIGQFIPVAPPQPAPPVAFADATGKPVRLADFAGRPAVINLWATWCAPCLKEMPALSRLQADFAGRLTVAAIAEDHGGGKIVAPFVARQKLPDLKIYLDPEQSVAEAFGVRGLPTSIVLDARLRVVGRVEGAADWTSEKMLSVLRPLLEKNTPAPLIRAAR
jgi:thiol-disulfide isomerase/thioredoxin